jgi:RNA polymerase sigma-70 factor (ECF subfamily)
VSDDRRSVERFLRDRTDSAFLPIYRAHAPALYAVALRLAGGSAQEAEDAVQEAWLRAVAALPRFEWRSALRTWLCGFVVNCCRELARRHTPDSSSVPDGLVAGISPETLELERAIHALPLGSREVFVLHDVHGYTHDEIASMLSIESGTSKSQLHHARRALRARLLGKEQP